MRISSQRKEGSLIPTLYQLRHIQNSKSLSKNPLEEGRAKLEVGRSTSPGSWRRQRLICGSKERKLFLGHSLQASWLFVIYLYRSDFITLKHLQA